MKELLKKGAVRRQHPTNTIEKICVIMIGNIVKEQICSGEKFFIYFLR
jgi:hypothetical protein